MTLFLDAKVMVCKFAILKASVWLVVGTIVWLINFPDLSFTEISLLLASIQS